MSELARRLDNDLARLVRERATNGSRVLRWTAGATLLLASLASAQEAQRPPVLRGRVVLVPIDVRVLDRSGQPVTDLKAEDIAVFEDGVRQEIAHFVANSLKSAPPSSEPIIRRTPNLESTPVSRRTFLIVLGRGRLQGAAGGIDAAIKFVRSRLLPQDHVGIVAYDRVSDFTTDRQSVIRLLERYRERHERVEALLDHWFMGLTAFYGGGEIPPSIEARIDEIFDVPDLPRLRLLHSLVPEGTIQFENERQALRREDVRRDFVYNVAARQDLEKLHAAVGHLRHLEGEKHIIFLSEDGLRWQQAEQTDRLATLAADARVTLSPIHTGGVETSWASSGDSPGVLFMGPSWQSLWANADSRAMAERTGGIVALYSYADRALAFLERSTRFQYLVGYYPTNPKWDGRERRIKVTVARENVRVLYRHSYMAHAELTPYDHRATVTQSRIDAASGYRLPVSDIPLKLSASLMPPKGDQSQLQVSVTVDPAKVSFLERAGRHVASLDIAIFVGAANQKQIGESRKRVDLNLTPENYARLRSEGVMFTASLHVKGRPRYVKAVVYDYASDLLGSSVMQIR